MPGVSAPNNTEPKGPKHLNMIEMAAPSFNNIIVITVSPDSRIPIHDKINNLKL